LEKEYDRPILLFTILTEFDSTSVKNIAGRGPVYHSAAELLTVLKGLYQLRQNELKFLKHIK